MQGWRSPIILQVSKQCRRAVAMRMEDEMGRERRAQWMASLAGPGWARRGGCHRMLN